MTLLEARKNNDRAYIQWVQSGRPEAYDYLNDSNRELIQAFKEVYPNAKGYRFYDGIIDLNGVLYNFCCDYIFDGSTNIINELMKESEEYKKCDILEKFNAICLVWT